MSQNANVVLSELLIEQESSYSSSTTFDLAEDGLDTLTELPVLSVTYAHNAERPQPIGTEGKQKWLAPQGLVYEGTINMELVGAEVTYSAAAPTTLPHGHDLILASGFSSSIEGNSVVYKRNPLDEAFSFAARAFQRNTYRDLIGGYSSLAIGFEEPGMPLMGTFTIRALGTVPVASSSIPTVTHTERQPPQTTCVTFTLNGSSSLNLRSLNYDMGRSIDSNRVDANSCAGIAGIALGRFDQQLTLVVEADPDTWDAYAFRDSRQNFAGSIVVGSTAGNIITLSWPQLQIVEVNEQEDGPTALLELVCNVYNSTPGNRDDVTLTYS